jgi:hypothetical protein
MRFLEMKTVCADLSGVGVGVVVVNSFAVRFAGKSMILEMPSIVSIYC